MINKSLKTSLLFLGAIFFSSCSTVNEFLGWDTPIKPIVSVQHSSPSKDIAIHVANRKAANRLEEKGCDPSMAKLTSYFRRTGLGYIGIAEYRINPKYCYQSKCKKRYDWANEENRTQANNWMWFPGSAKHSDKDQATIIAQGRALEYLVNECRFIHQNVKFHERCIDQMSNGKHVVFLRASIKYKYCQEIKYKELGEVKNILNKNLTGTYQYYLEYVSNKKIDFTVCNKGNFHCFDKGVEAGHAGDWYAALSYAKYSCKKGIKQGCNSVEIIIRFLTQNYR